MKIIATPFLNQKARKFMLRLRHEQHRKIKKAAALSGETMSRFVYRSVMQKADAVLYEHDELQLWDSDVPVGREFGRSQ